MKFTSFAVLFALAAYSTGCQVDGASKALSGSQQQASQQKASAFDQAVEKAFSKADAAAGENNYAVQSELSESLNKYCYYNDTSELDEKLIARYFGFQANKPDFNWKVEIRRGVTQHAEFVEFKRRIEAGEEKSSLANVEKLEKEFKEVIPQVRHVEPDFEIRSKDEYCGTLKNKVLVVLTKYHAGEPALKRWTSSFIRDLKAIDSSRKKYKNEVKPAEEKSEEKAQEASNACYAKRYAYRSSDDYVPLKYRTANSNESLRTEGVFALQKCAVVVVPCASDSESSKGEFQRNVKKEVSGYSKVASVGHVTGPFVYSGQESEEILQKSVNELMKADSNKEFFVYNQYLHVEPLKGSQCDIL